MSTNQNMLFDAVDRPFAALQEQRLAGWPEALAELGLELLFVPEDEGGFNGSWEDALIVLKQLGRHRVAAPLAETLAASWIILGSGLSLPAAPISMAARFEGKLVESDDGQTFLTGSLRDVPWGETVEQILVAQDAVPGSQLLLVSPSAARATEPGCNAASEARPTLHFEDAPATVVPPAEPELFTFLGALVRVCCAAGALNYVLELCVGHANDRVQFGRPIGKFQAIQQNLAILAGEVAAANCAASAACKAMQHGLARFEIAAAKLRVNQAITKATAIAHQTHGAIGITREHDLHEATQRLWAWQADFGNERHWSRWLGARVKQAGAAVFWSDLTAAGDR